MARGTTAARKRQKSPSSVDLSSNKQSKKDDSIDASSQENEAESNMEQELSQEVDFEDFYSNMHKIPTLSTEILHTMNLQCIDLLASKTDKVLNSKIVQVLKLISATFVAKDSASLKTLSELKEVMTKQNKPSFASIVKSSPTPTTTKPLNLTPEDTIIVKPNNPGSVNVMENHIKEIIKSSTTNFKVDKVINNKNVVIIKTKKSPATAELINQINSDNNVSSLGSAYTPKPRDPTIVLRGIPIDTDLLNIVSTITRKNEALNGLDKEIIYLFTIKHGARPRHDHNQQSQQSQHSQRPGASDLVFRVTPKVYQIIKEQLKFRLYLETEGFNVQDKVFVKQCQNCYLYGHKTADCRNKQICRSCGKEKEEGHTCTGPRCCSNCGKSERFKSDADHFPNNTQCPIYQSQIQRLRERTQYTTQHTNNLSLSQQ